MSSGGQASCDIVLPGGYAHIVSLLIGGEGDLSNNRI